MDDPNKNKIPPNRQGQQGQYPPPAAFPIGQNVPHVPPHSNMYPPQPSSYPYPSQQQPGQYPYPQHPTPIKGAQHPQTNLHTQGEPAQPKRHNKTQGTQLDYGDIIGRIMTMMLVFFLIGYFSWLYAPRVRNQMTFWPTNTPLPATATPTSILTPTITPLASNTPTPKPTETPGPLSEYWYTSGTEIDPAIPDAPDGLIVLAVDKSAEVNPALDSEFWTDSAKIVEALGKSLYQEHWYATYSPGWIRWFMDRPLREGLFEIYTMDTMYSSGGALDFLVKIGDQPLTSLTGSQHVEYMTSQYEPIQGMDTWRSLGMFFIPPSRDILNVTTSWKDRDEYTIVSVDRLAIVPRRQTDLALLNMLPQTGTRYIYDDLEGETRGGNFLLTQKDQIAWEDAYQLILNPKEKVVFTLPGIEPRPIGNYDLYAWMPTSKGGITANVSLALDGKTIANTAGAETVELTAPAASDGQWVKVGSWATDKYYERPRKIKITVEISADAKGEFPLDAYALIHTPF